MPVYCIRAGELGPCKLGFAYSVPDALQRLDSLQVAHWERLRLLRLWEGQSAEEHALHARFADLRIRGEWFSFSRLMLGDVGLKPIDISDLSREADAPMRAADICRLLGGVGDLARLVGTNRAAAGRWARGNIIPEEHWPAVLQRAAELGVSGITRGVLARMQPRAKEIEEAHRRQRHDAITVRALAFGSRLRATRLAAGLTIEALAAASGMSKDAIMSWESGRRECQMANGNKVGRVLGTTWFALRYPPETEAA